MNVKKNFVPLHKRPYLNIISIDCKSIMFKFSVLLFVIYISFRNNLEKIMVAAMNVLDFIFSLGFLPTDMPPNPDMIDLITYRKNIILNFGKVAIWILILIFILSFLFKEPLKKEIE